MTMKSILIAALAILGASAPLLRAEEPLPTVRTSKDWIIISGTGFEDKGPLPWVHMIRKDIILSINMVPDPAMIYPDSEPQPRKFHGTTEEGIAKLAACIDITTTELDSSGAAKTYTIRHLTNTTAPVVLEKIIKALDSTQDTPPE